MRYLMVKITDITPADLPADDCWAARLMGAYGEGKARQWTWVPNGDGADWVAIQAHYAPTHQDSLASSQYAWATSSVDGAGTPLGFFVETTPSDR